MQPKKAPWVLLAISVAFFPRCALAYLDPGTGSYIFQTLLGVLFGLAYVVKLYWRQIRAYFQHPRSSKRCAGRPEN